MLSYGNGRIVSSLHGVQDGVQPLQIQTSCPGPSVLGNRPRACPHRLVDGHAAEGYRNLNEWPCVSSIAGLATEGHFLFEMSLLFIQYCAFVAGHFCSFRED